MTHHTSLAAILLLIFAMAMIVLPNPSPSLGREDDAAEERLRKIEERLDDLEKVVNDDPMYPKRTLSARVDVLEESVDDLEDAEQADARTDQRGFDELEKQVELHSRAIEAMVRRIAEMEKNPPGEDDAKRELQAQARQINQLEDAMQSLKQRIDRLEAKR